MGLDRLSDADKALVGQALRAAVDGPFFPEWEFHTLFGLTRSEIRAIADAWPNVDLTSSDVALAANNALNNLLGYPHGQDSARPNGFPSTLQNWMNCSVAYKVRVTRVFRALEIGDPEVGEVRRAVCNWASSRLNRTFPPPESNFPVTPLYRDSAWWLLLSEFGEAQYPRPTKHRATLVDGTGFYSHEFWFG